jgi:hypothetical protein
MNRCCIGPKQPGSLGSLGRDCGRSLIAAPRAESMLCCHRLPTVRTRQWNGPAQGEVEKKSEQVRDESCDQCPEDTRHGAAASICIDVAQTENPDCDHNAHHQPEAAGREPSMEISSNARADEHPAGRNHEGCCLNKFRNHIQEFMDVHWDNPFAFIQPADKRCRRGKSKQRQREGTIHKASNPKCHGAGSRWKMAAAKPLNCKAANEPATVSTRAAI